jgi:haloalkane dehalogenase
MNMTINATDTHPRQRARILDSEISYVDAGQGDPIVFLHGNPTSSYLWRNIIPYATEHGRCLAPDLVGMGQSEKSPMRAYRFIDHARYLDAWFDALHLNRNIVLVLHDWGSALGFYRAFRHRDEVQAIVYMEAIVQPRRWEDFPNGRDAMFRALRSEQGEHMVLDENFFIEVVLPKSIIRKLSDEEMAAYRAPFLDREAGLPTLVWPRELPIEGAPADVVKIVERYGEWLAGSDLPKLFINADPGAQVVGVSATSAGTGRTNGKSRFQASTLSRRIRQTRSAPRFGSSSEDFADEYARRSRSIVARLSRGVSYWPLSRLANRAGECLRSGAKQTS